jgi:hypothetical protein
MYAFKSDFSVTLPVLFMNVMILFAYTPVWSALAKSVSVVTYAI